MKSIKIVSVTEAVPAGIADTETPVSVYLKLRDRFPYAILLESSDYHSSKNSKSILCFDVRGRFVLNKGRLKRHYPDGTMEEDELGKEDHLAISLKSYMDVFQTFKIGPDMGVNGLYGYAAYEAVQYFENIQFQAELLPHHDIPEISYAFYRYIITFDHFNNRLYITENMLEKESSGKKSILNLIRNQRTGGFMFWPSMEEKSNLTDLQYINMVRQGREACHRGDVFQIVLSRQFSQSFKGDEFLAYRTLRNINPSPYLFYFDFGNYKIFGSSPEAELVVKKGVAYINPIAGTFPRTGDDEDDAKQAALLCGNKKENAEHMMLVDLARNDLSRNSNHVKVETLREVQYYSHVLHLVSEVSGKLEKETNPIEVLGNTFPAGTLSGAPKYKAMELIDTLENQARGYYGGTIGYLSFDGDINHAIMIRSFLSKDNILYYQAGAGIVSESNEESELMEVNNKLGALKKAIREASTL